MKSDTLTPRQLMLSPDVLAYELGQIPSPEKIENRRIVSYVIVGVLATITIGVLSYGIYQHHKENKIRKQD